MIELENVAYSYGGGELLSDISLKLQPGSFHFLTGPSGSGKTTLMKLCYGALLPTSGHVRLFDADLRAMERDDVALMRRRIGVVHQDCQTICQWRTMSRYRSWCRGATCWPRDPT